ncbi:site-specific integrase [Pseudonocardia sp.]|uniref:tyrosine-type recombinase/integrase n=1 Tax=Pseudonocardia sp. TaxID=60912 RepID=UPI0026076637|nr:site-specific integrase [Pseudonocardia sp.]
MASIQKRPDGRWRARYRDTDGREHARHFTRKVDGQRWLDEVTASVVTGQYVDPKAGRVTFRQYAESWRAAQVHRPSSAAHVETMLRRHAYPVFGDRAVSNVRPSEVQSWVKGLALAPSTVHVLHGIVSAVFRAAVRDRMITVSPCDSTKLPRKVRTKVVPLPVDAVDGLADAVPPQYRALVVLCAGTGLRQGEAFGLTEDRVNFLRRSLEVDRQLIGSVNGRAKFGPPKTAASIRTVPLPTVVAEALAEHLRIYGAGPDGLLFVGDNDVALRRPWFSRHVWRPAVAAVKSAPAGTGMHDLRHFYASLLIRHGESVKVVQARLGHATAAETLDTYSHLWPDSDDTTRAAIDSVLGKINRDADSLRTETSP